MVRRSAIKSAYEVRKNMDLIGDSRLYFLHGDDYKPIGRVVEINTTEVPNEYYPDLSITNTELAFRMTLSRKDKNLWGNVFMMPRWKLTEWKFPRKKKRASKRRKRRNSMQLTQRDVLPEIVKKIVCRKLAERNGYTWTT